MTNAHSYPHPDNCPRCARGDVGLVRRYTYLGRDDNCVSAFFLEGLELVDARVGRAQLGAILFGWLP